MGKKSNQQSAKKRADKRNKRDGKKHQSVHMVDYKRLDTNPMSAQRALAFMAGLTSMQLKAQGLGIPPRVYISNDDEEVVLLEGERDLLTVSDHHVGAYKSDYIDSAAAAFGKMSVAGRIAAGVQDSGQTAAYIDPSDDLRQEALDWIKNFNEEMSQFNIPGVTITASLQDTLAEMIEVGSAAALRVANDRDSVMDDWLDSFDDDEDLEDDSDLPNFEEDEDF